ncbi:MAG: nickel-dependent lactate racemase [Spirochaetes bacterium]|nr:nickel-dependent lactate racemase [Spirochaetota bacterium]
MKTKKLHLPYGKDHLTLEIPEDRHKGEILSHLHSYRAEKSQEALVDDALANPVASEPLHVLAKGKNKVVLIASDHTRPVPSKIIVPRMLAEIRKGNPAADITILIATGCHRATTQAELADKFGADIIGREKIVLHDCDSADVVNIGKLPSGGEMVINRMAVEADLLVSEGFIEPHFFAGFSGGRKSVFPGVTSRETVVYNHNAEFIAHPNARTGVLDGNPVHIDMIFAAKAAKLIFICNVVLNAEKEVIHAVAGDCDAAHRQGAAFLASKCAVKPILADIAVSTNGGYPLDQNIYQAVKGMTAAEATVKKDGVIIMLAKSNDGHGGEEFYKTFSEEKNLDRMLETFMKTPKERTRVDQWQSQIFARVLKHAKVIFVSDAPDQMVRDLHMTPASSLAAALKMAEDMLGNPGATVTTIPDGIGVMVVE